MNLFPLVQIVYWLSLSTWFGGVLFVTLAAPIIVSSLRDSNPVLPGVRSENLEGQHASLLSGTIIGSLLAMLFRVEVICAGGLLVGLVGHWVLLGAGENLLVSVLRSCLYLGAVVFSLYDRWGVWPKVWKNREEYITHADEPDTANAALGRFEEHSRTHVTLLSMVLFLLLGMVLFSGNLHPPVQILGLPGGK